MSALDDVLAAVAAAMLEGGWRWYLFGAQAATLWGRPRLTADVDITVEIPFDRLDTYLEAMKRQGFQLGITPVRPTFQHRHQPDRATTRRR